MTEEKDQKRIIHIHVDEKLFREFKSECAKENKTMRLVLEQLIKRWLGK